MLRTEGNRYRAALAVYHLLTTRRPAVYMVVTAEHYLYALGDYAEVDYQAALERSA